MVRDSGRGEDDDYDDKLGEGATKRARNRKPQSVSNKVSFVFLCVHNIPSGLM